jgi:hypothetical protein
VPAVVRARLQETAESDGFVSIATDKFMGERKEGLRVLRKRAITGAQEEFANEVTGELRVFL